MKTMARQNPSCLRLRRREFEPRSGLSNARNRAMAAARGEYIVWTDDDVVVGAGWLTAYAEAFRRWPDAVVFGGRIKPRYEPPAARWVAESERALGGPFAIRDFGDEVQPLSVAESRSLMGRILLSVQQSSACFATIPLSALRPTGVGTTRKWT
jgi:GT2 family glycosyltransferase